METILWVSGGVDEKGNCKNTTEFISLDQPPLEGPKLPFTAYAHCMIQVDSKFIYLIGGLQNGKQSDKTWIIDPTNDFQMKVGPTMNYTRYWHSCATMRLNNKIFLVVFGRWAKPEILDTSSPTNKWKLGK